MRFLDRARRRTPGTTDARPGWTPARIIATGGAR